MKRFLALVISIILLFTFTGCSYIEEFISSFYPSEPTDEEISLAQQEFINIGYSNSNNEDDIRFVLSLDELKAWENPYSHYSSYILYNTLNEDEKLVYKALEYALVNSYERTFIDYRIGVNISRTEEILQLLSLDTPLLEQNVIFTVYNNVAFYDYEYSDTRIVEVLHRSNCVSVQNFTHIQWNQKVQALEFAQEFVDSLDEDMTQIQKAEAIYRHIAENVTYIPYENEFGHYKGALENFLFDAFVTKETHCDGFTNALALLYEMAGFEQVEKRNTITMQHTWNFVKIEDKWYNIEGTAGGYIPKEDCTMGSGLMFATPDIYFDDYCEFKELYPKAKTSYYMNPDGETESCNSDDFFDLLLEGFEKHNDEWAIVIVDEFVEDDARRELSNIADYYWESMYYYKKDTADDRVLLMYCKEYIMK
ncbi:MAG: transglutaminase domain-containing protein [Clostridia bacterium]|nr:transglutaminase domain-containing protein [Clostridia bacterium]